MTFFVWIVALEKCLTIDSLRKRKVCILHWFYVCKCTSETVDHLFLHCLVALELWDMVFGLFGVCWVMPMFVVELLACWQGRFGRHRNGYIWIVLPHCLMWCIWKERNSRWFENNDCLCHISSFYFLEPWFMCGETNPFLQFWIYLIYIIFEFDMYALVYSLCTWVSLFFISINLYYLSKKSYPLYRYALPKPARKFLNP